MKKSLAVFTIIIMLFSAVACNVHAQFARQGVVEFGGSIAWSSSTMVADGTTADNSTSLLNFMPYVNYFITNGFSVALSPGINMVKLAGASNSITNLDLFVVPGYTFAASNGVYPYVEVMLGYTAITSDGVSSASLGSSGNVNDNGFSYGGKAGVKFLVGRSGLLSLGVAYTALNFTPKGEKDRTGVNNIAVDLGFSVFIDN